MVFPILFALLLAKLKGYALRPLLKAYPLYPFALLTLLLFYFQASIFFQNYSYIRYAELIKSAYLISLLLPFVVYRLYKPGLAGAGLIVVGTLMNKFVMAQNGGKMPVYATLSRLTGYYKESMIGVADNIHSIGTAATKFKVLTDYIDIGFSILSPGDLLIHSFVLIILYYTIRQLNLDNTPEPTIPVR